MNNIFSGKVSAVNVVLFAIALTFIVVLHGALPFVLTPTLGQAVWTMGFSQSFVNDSLASIHAANFGAPQPAAIAFGLCGAWLAGIFLRFGLEAPDAYAAMAAVWITIAFVAAYSVARHYSVSRFLSVVAAVTWMTLPVSWAHASYSMLSMGIALLPLYFLFAIKIFGERYDAAADFGFRAKIWLIGYPVICLISVFMDGYTFMMFATGASILGVWAFFSGDKSTKRHLLLVALPIHIFGLITAYAAYTHYVGRTHFDSDGMDFFRAWGLDLTFLIAPTKGIHWLPDLIGWSVSRSAGQYFGDASVWRTTFCLPLLVGGIWAAFILPRKNSVVLGFVLVALFGYYMSLGPSLKINSLRPHGVEPSHLMPEEFTVASTGSAIISENIPGFNSMRASYRWVALGAFGTWSLLVLAMSQNGKRRTVVVGAIFAGVVTLSSLPNLSVKWSNDATNRSMFLSIESDLISALRGDLNPKDRVAFLPWRNDFLVNYVAARLNIVTFNIGGDKNLLEAKKHWPATMRGFPMARVDEGFTDRVLMMLANREVDAVVLPYIDTLWAAHQWPHPIEFKKSLSPVLAQLLASGFVEVVDRNYYAVIRLDSRFSDKKSVDIVALLNRSICAPPYCLRQKRFNELSRSKVGSLQDGRLVSTGNAGFLHFGPYVPLNQGRYKLVARGSCSCGAGTWIDVASDAGRVVHKRLRLDSTKDGVLAEGIVDIASAAKDVEVRLYVDAATDILFESYELVPAHDEGTVD